MLGGFCLTHEIASGGMAAVYLAHRLQHARIGQAAAVKVIHPHLARDEDFVEMFLDEARIVSCISHPNVCRVLDFGNSDGTYYLAMDYVMGETLADVLTRLSAAPEAEKVAVPLLSQIIAQACEGLHAAHEARDAHGKPLNIVHRDISPQNIMVGYDGSVRILDFGVASASERLHSTRNGKIKGRLAYMAPEQMRGLPVDRRADLWSLGVVLWEGLAGKRLFKRDDEVQTIVAVTHEALPSLAAYERTVPLSLQRIVTRTLMRNRDSRYATARELGLALSQSAATSLPRAGAPELSVWMHSLFGDRIEPMRALMRAAAAAAEASATPSGPATPMLYDTYDDDVEDETRIAVPRPQLRSGPPRSTIRSTVPRLPVRRLARRSLLTLVTMLLLGVPAPCRAPAAERIVEHARVSAAPVVEQGRGRAAHPVKRAPLPAAPVRALSAVADPTPVPVPAAAEEGAPAPSSTLAARKPQTGAVTVNTTSGWADVYLGERKLGTTPVRAWLPVGARDLRLVPFGSEPSFLRRVIVRGGQGTELQVKLE